MMLNERKDIRALLLKFGAAIALSFAGFLYSRIRTRPCRPSLPPPPSDYKRKDVDSVDRAGIKDDVHGHGLPRMPSCREIAAISAEAYEKASIRVSADNSSTTPSPTSRHSGDKEYLLPEFNDIVREFDTTGTNTMNSPRRDVETLNPEEGSPKSLRSVNRDDYEQEINSLRNMVARLRERERYLEFQLLEYYGLKEQETAVMELQNRLKINNMEAKLFSLKIESLQADNRRLESQVSEYTKVVSELEAAKAKIKCLKKKLRTEAEQNREQILKLKQRVARLQEDEKSSDSAMQSKPQSVKALESEAEELRNSNLDLHLENSELAWRLESAQTLANSVLEDPEVENLKGEAIRLREANEHLTKEVERLQADRCADAEELVYLRWINACLRYELRNFQPATGKTVARDLSKSLSPRSEGKAKKLILEYANTEGMGSEKRVDIADFEYDQWSSSQSYHTDSGEPDDSSVDISTANKFHAPSKKKFFSKLRKLITGKEGPHHHDDHDDHHRSRSSSMTKSHSVDDFRHRYSYESHQANSSIDVGNDEKSELRSPRYTNRTPSQNSTRSSLDLQKLTSLNEMDNKDIESINRSSSGSSHGYRRFVITRESANTSPLESIPDRDSDGSSHKSDIMKYAEVLRDSPWTRRTHRKSASFSPG